MCVGVDRLLMDSSSVSEGITQHLKAIKVRPGWSYRRTFACGKKINKLKLHWPHLDNLFLPCAGGEDSIMGAILQSRVL